MTTGSIATLTVTTVFYLGTNPKPHTLTKSIFLIEYFQAADPDLEKRYSWQVPTPYGNSIKIGQFNQPIVEALITAVNT